MALQAIHEQEAVDVIGLLTTVNADADRVAMHAVRRTLLEAQADRLGLPLHVIPLPSPCPNDVYEARMSEAMVVATASGIDHVVFGDLFLADVRAYREQALAGSGITPLFPLWGRPTEELAQAMIAGGFRAIITCVDPAQLAPRYVGRHFDELLLDELPAAVDPCGERGEFHTFVWDAPQFRAPVDVEVGEVVQRDGFVFCDLLPAPPPSSSNVSAPGGPPSATPNAYPGAVVASTSHPAMDVVR